jgi:hypothetical protein
MNKFAVGSSSAVVTFPHSDDRTGKLPALPNIERVYANAHRVRCIPSDQEFMPEAQAALDGLNAVARPATELEIANHLTILITCYPNAGVADRSVYSRVLAEDVATMQPSIGVVESSCRNMRRTLKFCPAICEVLDAVKAAIKHHQYVTDHIAGRAKAIAQLDQKRQLRERRLFERERSKQIEHHHNVEEW